MIAEVALAGGSERRIARSTASEPDCIGMCSCGQTFGVSAIAAMTSSVKSRGCGLVNRTRSRPVDLAAGPQQLAEREPVAEGAAVGVDVLPEQGHLEDAGRRRAHRISASTSPGRRSVSAPRSAGTMQNVQVLSQPTEIDTQALYGDSRRRRQVGREVLQRLDDLDLRPRGCAARVRAAPAARPGCGCRTRRRPTAPSPGSCRGPSGPGSRRPRSACRAGAAWPGTGGRGCRTAGCRRSRGPRRC